MTASYADLLTPVTVAEAETLILGLLEAVGFPATAWQKFSVPRTLVRLTSELYSDARTGLVSIVLSRLIETATGDALTARARSFFLIERAKATATKGRFVLDDNGGAPYTIFPNQLLIKDLATNLMFTNTTGGSLAAGGTLTIDVQGAGTGSAYNIGTGSALDFARTLEGVLVTNPAIGATGTWITTSGTDQQSDVSLRLACWNRWATVGAGTAGAYIAWALEGSPSLTKLKVYEDEPDGPGTVRVVVATDAGAASAEEVTNANAVVQAKRPAGLGGVIVSSATAVPVPIDATVYLRAGWVDTYAANLEAARNAYQTALQIGEDVYMSRVDALLHAPGGVRNAVITDPGADILVGDQEIAVLTFGTITLVVVQ